LTGNDKSKNLNEMNDLGFAIRQLQNNPGPAVGPTNLRRGLPSRFLCAVARRNFEARHQHDVHSLGIVGSVMPENVHFTPAARQGDEIRMFHQQTATVSHMNEKGAEGLRVEQFPDVIRSHVFNVIEIPNSRKPRGPALAGFGRPKCNRRWHSLGVTFARLHQLPPPLQGGLGLRDGFPRALPWADMPHAVGVQNVQTPKPAKAGAPGNQP
jgi:hypothetical protein